MSLRQAATLVLIVALALLGGSVAWVANASGSPSPNHSYAYGPGMMGYGYTAAKASPVTGIVDARERARAFADKLGLQTGEVLRFDRNYYVKLVDKQGANATEVLVDPATGAVSFEYGPAMMWNTKYGMQRGMLSSGMMSADAMRSMMGSYGGSYSGMMVGDAGSGMMGRSTGGMMGGGYGVSPVAPAGTSVSLARAHVLAQSWLDTNEPGTTVEAGGDGFPGYYTLETLRDGRTAGMISVNATTGAVWPHWWHGSFIESAA